MSNNNIDLVSLVNQALCLWKDSDFINCRELCIKALNIVRQLDPSTPKMMISHAELLKCLGNLEHQQGNYTESLDYYSQALTISKKLNAKDLVAKITNNIATIYYLLEDYKKAISFYYTSKSIKEELNDYKDLYNIYNNLARAYSKLSKKGVDINDNQLNEEEIAHYQNIALINLYISLKIIKDYNIEPKYSIATHNNIASLYTDMLEFDSAIEEFKIAEELAKKNNSLKSYTFALAGLANIYKEKKDYSMSFEYLYQAKEIAIRTNSSHQLKFISKDLAATYAELGNFQKAYEYQLEHSRLLNKIFSNELKSKIATIESHFEIERKDKEIEIIKLKNIELHNAYHEINEQKNKLESLYIDLNEFLGVAVHDLKNPISGILGLCELTHYHLTQKTYDYDLITNNIGLIQNQTEKMFKIVKELLNISAFETGRLKLNLVKACFYDIFNERNFYYKILAEQKDIRLIVHEENIKHELVFDKDKMADVIDNLITNAIKYTKPKGTVDVTFSIKDNKYYINISDTGIGLNSDELSLLFKEFKTFSAKPTANESSTGFGLLIVKKIIDLHSGNIYACSEKDIGTTFTIELNI